MPRDVAQYGAAAACSPPAFTGPPVRRSGEPYYLAFGIELGIAISPEIDEPLDGPGAGDTVLKASACGQAAAAPAGLSEKGPYVAFDHGGR